MKTGIKAQFLVSLFFTFFLTHTMQLGVGALSFQREIAAHAGHDAWMVVIFTGVMVHIWIWMIYTVMNKEKQSIIHIHHKVWGTWLGGIMSFIFSLIIFSYSLVYLEAILEIIRVWIFPSLNKWTLVAVYLMIVYSIVVSGFRTVVGISVFSVLFPLFLWLTFLNPLEVANYRNLLPIGDHSIKELLLSMKTMSFGFLGFELLLFYYPFLQNPEKSQKWAHLGNLYTTCIYLILILVTTVYFSPVHLSHTVWPTLSMWQIVRFPFIERFEVIGITIWVIILLPNICLSCWAASRGLKELFRIRQKSMLPWLLSILFLMICFISGRYAIESLSRIISNISFYIIVVYIPLFFVVYHIRNRMEK
ncbi:GerAB/ArcD/ProY family transporter [Bacillus thuringiensis]